MRTDDLCAALTGWLERLMPEEDRRAALIAELSRPDDRPVDPAVCAELQERARRFSRHLDVEWVPEGGLVPDTESRGWPEPDAAEVAVRRADISAWHFGEIGVLTVAGLSPLVLAEPFLDAALAELHGAPAVVLDLRANGGGDLDTAMAVLGWLLGPEPVHVSDVVSKDGMRRWHSDPRAGLAPETPAAALIGAGTYSSGEGLAYHFQAQRLGPLIGARTPGAADHVTPIVLHEHVRANLPRGYVVDAVTRTNWEQAGVRPDIPCAESEALERALALYAQSP
ncbi:MAG TPA: S41 family peptidase [Solirubrobacteraceae bacterium]|nr:S41 family peptidase [Solirubrobacteraceae bacterium]